MASNDRVREQIRRYYGELLKNSDDLSTDATCCSAAAPPKYVIDALKNVDPQVIARFYGCGSPIPVGLEGATVLDLGCGTGRDVYIASQLVGEHGRVIGIDMTPSQLDFAKSFEESHRERFGYAESNVTFIEGFIEDMEAIPSESVDLVISNCVVNLSPFKQQLFEEVFRVLKPGGELYFSDVFSDRRVPEGFYDDPVLRGECLSGALYIEDFRRMLADCGVKAFYEVSCEELHIGDFRIATKLGCIGFTSRTIRAIKSAHLEDREENYGQTATYLGTLPENKRYFDLSSELRLIKGRAVAVSGNMATLLSESRYAPHFQITSKGDHLGPYRFEQAQHALELARGKGKVDLPELERRHAALGIAPFCERVHDKDLLSSAAMATMQVNVGYACNLSCSHCFLECGPKCTEQMDRKTMEAVLDAFAVGGYKVMDITGGSPEMNPHLEWFLDRASGIAEETIVRSNLVVLGRPEFAHFKEAYVRNKVKLVCSLPYYDESGCDSQRGKGTFKAIMDQLRSLNGLGYGIDSDLQIDLVYNVDGPFLPPDQRELRDFYAVRLREGQGVEFNGLYAFNNFTLGRFAHKLDRAGKMDYYLNLLAENYNAAVVAHMMCRTQVDVDWDGTLYDCECNHVLGLPIMDSEGERPLSVFDIAQTPIGKRTIRTNPICYACAAGCGSSCGGALLEKVTFADFH